MGDLLVTACAVAALLGILSHLFYFIRGEHHAQALALFQLTIILLSLSAVVLVQLFDYRLISAIQTTACVASSYIGSLWASMVIYRVFFHPLRHFPSPRLAKVSKFYHSLCCWNLDNHRVRGRWHDQYGEFVRIGPNELSIISANATTTILGPKSICLKSGWYDYVKNQPLESLHSARDLKTHEARRRVWDRGFGMRALHDYEVRVLKYSEQLLQRLSSLSHQVVNSSDWFHYYGFDVMGDLAFGKSFNMLQSGERHMAVKLFNDGMAPSGMLSPVIWMIPLLAGFPSFLKPKLAKGYEKFIAWCSEQVEKRRLMKPERPDITSWLLDDLNGSHQRPEEAIKWLHGDARLIVVAGSGTVAAVLSHIFYHFAVDATIVEKLRTEIKGLWKEGTPFNVWDFQNADYLNGVINEAMRMHPPVPSGVQRITPPEGVTIDGVFVPGGVNIAVSSWAIGRSPAHYVSPQTFIPERWSTQPDLIINRNTFAPFSLGPFGCIGRNLALMEMRTVICLLVSKLDIRLAEGEDGRDLLEGSKDFFTLMPGTLRVVFTDRAGAKVGEGEA